MAHLRQTTFPVIGSGAVVSGAFPLSGGTVGLWAPVITSAQVFLQVGFDSTSANMVRAYRAGIDPSSHWVWPVGPGSAAVMVDPIGGFSFARLESSVAQADTRSFAVMQKL